MKLLVITIFVFFVAVLLGSSMFHHPTTTIKTIKTSCLPEDTSKLSSPITLLPLGDSLTHGISIYTLGENQATVSGYRETLSDLLTAEKWSVDFLGPLSSGSETFQDKDHAGYDGATIDILQRHVENDLSSYKPAIILLMIGTNDLTHNVNQPDAIKRMSTLLTEIENHFPTSYVFIASLPPSTGEGSASIPVFNQQLQQLIQKQCIKSNKLHFVSMDKISITDLADGAHLTSQGYEKMARIWFDKLEPFFNAHKK